MSHVIELKVRFHELDPYGHVNHGVYLNYFETGRIEALEAVGWGLEHLKDAGYMILVVDLQARFVAPAGPGDTLRVETAISTLRRASSVWSQRILRGDELIATVDVRGAITDLEGRPTRPPTELVDALAPLLQPDAMSA